MLPTENSVKVAVRCRPLIGDAEQLIGPMELLTCMEADKQIVLEDKVFNFDHVYDATSSQGQVFDTSVVPVVEKFLAGYNAAVIVYGQTGSGKTHTMGITEEQQDKAAILASAVGDAGETDDNCGLIPRILHKVFANAVSEDSETRMTVSFIETYKEEVFDILDEKKKKIVIRENFHQIMLPGLTEKPVLTFSEALKCLVDGARIRATGSTAANAQSSRSHAIFYLTMDRQIGTITTRCRFYLVDLAGSESVRKTKTLGDRFKEGVDINQGLLSLGKVIRSLSRRDKANCFVPYRDTTLTRLLQNCLQSNCHTLLIACISPLEMDIVETNTTLKFALGASGIKIKYLVADNREPMSARKALHWNTGCKSQKQLPSVFKTPCQPRPRPFPSLASSSSSITSLDKSTERVAVALDFDAEDVGNHDDTIISSNIPSTTPSGVSSTQSTEEAVVAGPGFTFKRPETPNHTPSRSQDMAFSPYIRRMCTSMQIVMERMVDRFSVNSARPRELLDTPQRQQIVHSVVDELNRTRSSIYVMQDCSNGTPEGRRTDLHRRMSSTVRKLTLSVDRSTDENCSPLETTHKGGGKSRLVSQRRDCAPSTPSNLTIRRSSRLSVLLPSPIRPAVVRRSSRRRTVLTLDSTSTADVTSSKRRRPTVSNRNDIENVKPTEYSSPVTNRRRHVQNILHVLNTGSLRKLQQLPTVGPKSALMIHNFVSINGDLKEVGELKTIPGLPKTFSVRFLLANMCA